VQYNDKQRRRSKSTNANVAEISGPNARAAREQRWQANRPYFFKKGVAQ
jgi:hypothetical protein